MLDVTIPIRTSSESNERGHWSKKARRAAEQRSTVAAVLRTRVATPPSLPVAVTLVRVAPSAGLDRHDNLTAALKACADAVTDWLGLTSDRVDGLTFRYDQARGPWGVRVQVRALPVFDPARPGARVVEEPEGTRVELVLRPADLETLAGAIEAVRGGQGKGVELRISSVRLVLRAGGV